MTAEHFSMAVQLARRFYLEETQFELNLAGIGESTLHPLFPSFIRLARHELPAAKLVFATNGVDLAELHPVVQARKEGVSARQALMGQVMDALVWAKSLGPVEVFVSLHRPERAGLAVDVLANAGVFGGVSADPSVNADDWAGQVKWKRTHQQRMQCQFLRDGKVMVLADGRVTTCCLDASGVGVIGHVEQPVEQWKPQKPFSLCKTCQYEVPKEMR